MAGSGRHSKNPKKSRLFIMGVDVVAVDDGGNAARDVPAFGRKEKGRLGVMEERVLLAEEELHLADERRHPVRVPFVHGPGEPDEPVEAFLSETSSICIREYIKLGIAKSH